MVYYFTFVNHPKALLCLSVTISLYHFVGAAAFWQVFPDSLLPWNLQFIFYIRTCEHFLLKKQNKTKKHSHLAPVSLQPHLHLVHNPSLSLYFVFVFMFSDSVSRASIQAFLFLILGFLPMLFLPSGMFFPRLRLYWVSAHSQLLVECFLPGKAFFHHSRLALFC